MTDSYLYLKVSQSKSYKMIQHSNFPCLEGKIAFHTTVTNKSWPFQSPVGKSPHICICPSVCVSLFWQCNHKLRSTCWEQWPQLFIAGRCGTDVTCLHDRLWHPCTDSGFVLHHGTYCPSPVSFTKIEEWGSTWTCPFPPAYSVKMRREHSGRPTPSPGDTQAVQILSHLNLLMLKKVLLTAWYDSRRKQETGMFLKKKWQCGNLKLCKRRRGR